LEYDHELIGYGWGSDSIILFSWSNWLALITLTVITKFTDNCLSEILKWETKIYISFTFMIRPSSK